MPFDPPRIPADANPLQALVLALAWSSAKATADLGIELDMEDLRVARWLMLTTLEGAVMSPGSRSPMATLLEEAAAASACDPPGGIASKCAKRRTTGPLITWDDLMAAAKEEDHGRAQPQSRAGRRVAAYRGAVPDQKR